MSLYLTRQINTPEKRVVWILASAVLGAFLLYGYFIHLTISAIVVRTDMMKSSKYLMVELGELESEYNAARKTLTYEYARSLGFREAEAQVFAKRARLASIGR